MPAPKRQHVTPSIDLGGVTRIWTKVPASQIRAGDLIPDFGLVHSVDKEDTITFRSVSGATMLQPAKTVIFAFTNA